MTDEEKEIQIIKKLAILAASFPNFTLPKETVNIYVQFLKDYDLDLLDQAFKVCMTTKKFFPALSEIREAVADLMARVTGLPSAADAWGEVVQKIQTYGHTLYASAQFPKPDPEFSHPIITNLVQRFGWNNLCLSENIIADRARFLEAYDLATRDAKTNIQMLPETHQAIENMVRVNAGVQSLAKQLSAGFKRQ